MAMKKRDIYRKWLILIMAALLILTPGVNAEENPEDDSDDYDYYYTEDDEEYGEYDGEGEEAEFFDENQLWYVVQVSEPDGDGGGKPVILEYDAEDELPEDGEYRWYTCDQSGQAGEFLAVTRDNRYETEGFDKPEVRYYLCELSAGGESFANELFAAGFTGLPLVRINTERGEEIAYHDYYLSGSMVILDGETALEVPISVKGRGNSTFGHPKKPYTVKLEKKRSLLGMGETKKWALLAGYCDKTLLRAPLGFKVSELMNLAYTPAYRYVDLVINGEYAGNYLLTETPKEESKRLNISKSGFMVEESQNDTVTNDPHFRSEKNNLLFRFHYPDKEKITAEIQKTVSGEIDRMEQALLNLGAEDDLPEEIDADSWINWMLVQNILANMDTNRYYYKTGSGGKICMGPAWDFERSVGIGWDNNERANPNHKLVLTTDYLRKLMENKQFVKKLKERWQEVSGGLTDILIDFMEETAREIRFSRELNFCRWTIMNQKIFMGGNPLGSWEAEFECDKTYLKEHLLWLNEHIGGM